MPRHALLRFAPCLAVLALPACGDDKAGDGDTDSGAGTASLSGEEPGAEDSASAEGSGGGEEGGDPSAADEGDADGAGDAGDEQGSGGEAIDPGQLTAGEWRDLDHWDFWLGLLQSDLWRELPTRWGFYTEQRYAVVVVGPDEAPVADAKVVLYAGETAMWTARTDVHGAAEVFAGMFGDPPEGPRTLEVSVDGAVEVVEDPQPGWQAPLVVPIEAAAPAEPILDLMFMVDTTGSMDDELSYLQAELADVLDRVRAQVGQDVTFRVSVNFYRDEGDEYVVRPFAFTTDVDQAIADLGAQEAGGGGDIPEAVDAALASVVEGHAWSDSAVARLCFLVLDAPPHDDLAVLSSVRTSVKAAAAKGIRVIPLAASGTDKDTEFLLRMAAIASGGTYTFLTDHSGIGGGHTEPTIGAYQVELLNDLLVRLISEALVD